jgi:hypothetical protein
VLYEDSWRLWHTLESLGALFSLHPTHRPHHQLAVTSSTPHSFAVFLLELQRLLPFSRQEHCPRLVERLVPLHDSQYLLVVEKESSHLVSFSAASRCYEPYPLGLPQSCGDFLAANEYFFVTSNHILRWRIPDRQCTTLLQGLLLLVSLKGPLAAYLDQNLQVYSLLAEEEEGVCPKPIRKAAPTEYLWTFLSDGSLLVADSSNFSSLAKYDGPAAQLFTLPHNGVISAMAEVRNSKQACFIAIGYSQGRLHLLNGSFELCHVMETLAAEPVSFFGPLPSQSLGVLSGSRAFTLDADTFEEELLCLPSTPKRIQTIAYSQLSQELIYVHEKGQG